MIRKIHETNDTMDKNRLHRIHTSLECAVTKNDRIQPLMQELQQLARERVGENADPGVQGLNEFSQKGNYGQSNTTNKPPMSFGVSFNSVNNTNKINEATEKVRAIMKDDSDVAICSPGEESDNSDNE
ncbi:hypothetical protein AVEN_221259-1 [Araneus ventricosus]|uniref:Uncharacterized protein n=1 Tax=Araneus ventricosus TaxID=182803 RepID=A0A4Y2CMY8_ARAVE|nr:hypothetical protein AVEN_266618-1 [Araneus ventricosus]GBN17728.1 hypothetical protein AVEN_221259-1 [Araneus ventricosus]